MKKERTAVPSAGEIFARTPKNVKNILLSEIKEERLAHAYIFEGPDRKVKFETATDLAKILNCREKTACGECGGCRETQAEAQINQMDVEPEDILPVNLMVFSSATSIGIRYIQKMIKALALKKQKGRFAVAVIKEGELLTNDAANCMLKLLEEPPDRTCVIIISSNIHSLLPTIRSRSQILRFPPAEDLYLPPEYDKNSVAHLLTSAEEGRWSAFFDGFNDFMKSSARKQKTASAVKREKTMELVRNLLLDGASKFSQRPAGELAREVSYLLRCNEQLKKQSMPNIVLERMFLKGVPSFLTQGRPKDDKR